MAHQHPRTLVTGSRLPVGLAQIRKLGRAGHYVVAADSLATSPGNHSRYAAASGVTTRPKSAPATFASEIAALVGEHGVALVVPSFEEVFYLAARREELGCDLFAPSVEVLGALHDKVAFGQLCTELGLRTLPTTLAGDLDELRAACAEHERFFARPAFSRGGVTLFTNAGPLAGALALEDLRPSAQNPFLVQPYLEGLDVCSYSIVHHGRVLAHTTYVHPHTLEHAGGIVFESIESDETLRVARAVAAATGYHGHLSFDYRQADDELVLIECNPRPTSGILVMPDSHYAAAVAGIGDGARVTPAGRRRQISMALLRNALVHTGEATKSLGALATGGPDVYFERTDPLPALYQLLSYGKVLGYKLRNRASSRHDLMQGYFEDLTWDGDREALAAAA